MKGNARPIGCNEDIADMKIVATNDAPKTVHPLCNECGWRKGGVDSWDGNSCKCKHSEPPTRVGHEHVWRTDGMHQNEFCGICFVSKPTSVARKPETVADLMCEWRALSGLSRKEAGARLGLSENAIRDIEQGLRRADDRLTALGLKKLIEDAK